MGKWYEAEMIAGLKTQLNFTDAFEPMLFLRLEARIALTFSFLSSSSSFFYFPLPVQGLFVIYIADSADRVRAAKLFLGLEGLFGAQGSYLSACPPTSLLQEPKFMAMQKSRHHQMECLWPPSSNCSAHHRTKSLREGYAQIVTSLEGIAVTVCH